MKQAMIQCPCGYAWTAGTARCRECGSSLPADLIDAQLAAERARAERMAEALREVEEWWLSEGMKHFNGAPYAMFAVRAALTEKPS